MNYTFSKTYHSLGNICGKKNKFKKAQNFILTSWKIRIIRIRIHLLDGLECQEDIKRRRVNQNESESERPTTSLITVFEEVA